MNFICSKNVCDDFVDWLYHHKKLDRYWEEKKDVYSGYNNKEQTANDSTQSRVRYNVPYKHKQIIVDLTVTTTSTK